jgi:chitodextrinase
VGARVTFNNGLYEAVASTTNVPPDYCPSCGWWRLVGTCGGAADTTAPSVPTGLASPSKTTTTVGLSWNASTDNAGGSGVAGYDVFRDNASVGSPSTTSFTDSGLAPGSTHSYAVRARDNAGNASARSATISVTTVAQAPCQTLPSVPGGLASSGVTASSVTLSWTASTPGANCTVQYNVFQNGTQVMTVSGTSVTIGGLAASTTFSFRVSAVNQFGSSAQSAALAVTTAATPPSSGADQLRFDYTTTVNNATTFTGHLLVSNPNAAYAWNGSFFAVRNVDFQMTSTVTSINSTGGAIPFTASGGLVTLDLGYQSLLAMGQAPVDITFTATKAGATVFPVNFRAHYMRGEDIVYPQYAGLPASWSKNKANLAAADLIASATSYYQGSVPASSSKLIVYTPQHPTQLLLGQVMSVPYPVNTVNGVRIWIPTRFMALGLGAAYEFFKLNPNFMVSLGTKENFAAGFVGPSAGNSSNPTVIDGVTWFWPIVLGHPDGPYQQETGNFNDTRSFFPDWLPPAANHGDYTTVQTREDPLWITAGISSAISITVTREQLNAIPVQYTQFMQQAHDPYAEFACVDYAYNRGINDFYSKKIFTTNRAAALASTNISADFGLSGFASHVETVRAILDATNASTDIYDGRLTWADMQTFLGKLRVFYARGVPSDAEWSAMTADVQRAFNVLAAHWGNGQVSVRYDFLTLLRVAEQYLPQPRQPRPTGPDWYYQVKNATP